MKCLNQNCNAKEIGVNDNFCYKCGHWTTKGFSFLRNENNVNNIINGAAIKQDTRFTLLVSVSIIGS